MVIEVGALLFVGEGVMRETTSSAHFAKGGFVLYLDAQLMQVVDVLAFNEVWV